jgi:hypothetical protein
MVKEGEVKDLVEKLEREEVTPKEVPRFNFIKGLWNLRKKR